MKYHKHEIKNVTKSQLCRAIDECVIGFKAERNRLIMYDRLCGGFTFEHLAEVHDMSVNQIKNIVYRELEKISAHLEAEV